MPTVRACRERVGCCRYREHCTAIEAVGQARKRCVFGYWGPTSVSHYRTHGDAPCDSHIYQQMQIACGPLGFETYHGVQNNILISEIGTTTVTVTRDGVQAGPVSY